MRAMVSKSNHIPFRANLLTRYGCPCAPVKTLCYCGSTSDCMLIDGLCFDIPFVLTAVATFKAFLSGSPAQATSGPTF